jgi:hypothetical protein
VIHDGQEWTFKAVGLLALKFGLFQGNTQLGTIATIPLCFAAAA